MKGRTSGGVKSGAIAVDDPLEAIRRGEVDAIVVNDESGPRLYALHPFDLPYQQLFEALPDSALVLDDAGCIRFCTPSFCTLVGTQTASVERTLLREHVAPSDQARFDELLGSAAKGPAQGEVALRSASGSIPTRVALSPLPSAFFPDRGAEDRHFGGGFVAIVRQSVTRASEVSDVQLAGRVEDLASSIISARDEERAHLSEQMNDVVLPVLTDVGMDLEWIEERLRWSEGRPHSSIFARLRAVRDQLDRLAGRARRFDPPLLRAGFAEALEARADQLRERGLDLRFELQLSEREPGRLAELRLYRIVDQILTSLIQPSNAANATIEIAYEPGSWRVTSRDNARGAETYRNPRRATALNALRAYITELRGYVNVRDQVDRGTTIYISIPEGAKT